jgi:hypothetical protein
VAGQAGEEGGINPNDVGSFGSFWMGARNTKRVDRHSVFGMFIQDLQMLWLEGFAWAAFGSGSSAYGKELCTILQTDF